MPVTLREMFDRVLDPRKSRGRIHDLGPILCLAVVAMLAGRTTLQGIVQFGRDHGVTLAHALGFRRAKTPCAATYSRLFRRFDVGAFETLLREWVVQRCPAVPAAANSVPRSLSRIAPNTAWVWGK